MKEASLKRLHTLSFHLSDILEKPKLWGNKTDQRLPETGVGPDYKGQKEIFGLTEMFHILIMVIVMWLHALVKFVEMFTKVSEFYFT